MDAIYWEAAAGLLIWAVLPVWMLAGLADYFCHRFSRIERTSGIRESALHLLQFGLIGMPLVLSLFFDVNAGFLLLAALCILVHHGVAYIDIAYAGHTRAVSPIEQMVHSFLEILPITAFLLLGVLHWPQLQSLFGMGTEAARFAPELRVLPMPFILSVLGGALVLNLIPYLEELYRCGRAVPTRSVSTPP